MSDKIQHTAVHVVRDCSQLFLIFTDRAGCFMTSNERALKSMDIHDRNRAMFIDWSVRDFKYGISPSIANMSDFIQWQRALIEAHFPHVRDIYCIGASSGAYAAVACGYFLKATMVCAFGVPMIRFFPLPFEDVPKDSISERCADLRHLLRDSNGTTEFKLYYNKSCGPDHFVAQSLAVCPGVRLYPQEGSGHLVVWELLEKNMLSEAMVPTRNVRS